jgi:DNA-binding response OmpR family regulator
MYIEDLLADLGYEVIGIAADLRRALALARDSVFDFAVLDINLAGDMSFPVADVLRERGIPFLFVSGYTSAGVPEAYRNEPRLGKPLRTSDLAAAIRRI